MSVPGKALFDYKATAPNQVSFLKGDDIKILSVGPSGGWSKGQNPQGVSGFYPSDYVQVLAQPQVAAAQPAATKSSSSPTTSLGGGQRMSGISPAVAAAVSTSVGGGVSRPTSVAAAPKWKAKVMYKFAGAGANEMALNPGDIIDVYMKGGPGGWCKGAKGAFPTDYVQFLPDGDTGAGSSTPVKASPPASTTVSAAATPVMGSGSKADVISSAFDFDSSPTKAAPPGRRPSTSTGTGKPDLSNLLGVAKPISDRPVTKTGIDFRSDDPFGLKKVNPTPTPASSSTFGSSGGADLLGMVNPPKQDQGQGQGLTSTPSVDSYDIFGGENDLFGGSSASSMSASQSQPVSLPPPSVYAPAQAQSQSASTPDMFGGMGGYSGPQSQPAAAAPMGLGFGGLANVGAATASVQASAGSMTGLEPPKKAGAPPPPPASRAPSEPSIIYAKVLYGRSSEGDTELTIRADDILVVAKAEGEWWYGSSASEPGVLGFFPASYVEKVNLDSVLKIAATKVAPASSAAPGSGARRFEEKRSVQTGSRGSAAPLIAKKSDKVQTGTFSFTPDDGLTSDIALWKQFVFTDFFCDLYPEYTSRKKEEMGVKPAIARMKRSMMMVKNALEKSREFKHKAEELTAVYNLALAVFQEGIEMCDSYATHNLDANRMFVFLVRYMERVKSMRVGDILAVPCAWEIDSTSKVQHAALMVVRRDGEDSEADFSLTIINTGIGKERGLDYHAFSLDLADASMLRNLCFELKEIDNMKIGNTAFWLLVFKTLSRSQKEANGGSMFVYEKLLPYVIGKPVLAGYDRENCDYRSVPLGGDVSFMHCAFELLRHIGRLSGLTAGESLHLPALCQSSMLHLIVHDMSVVQNIPEAERESIRICLKKVASVVGEQVGVHEDATFTKQQAEGALTTIQDIQMKLDAMDVSLQAPMFDYQQDHKIKAAAEFAWMGRFRKDTGVDHLAGTSLLQPINRPIEMTLVSERVTNFAEAQEAMRHAVNLCTLLANQADIVRNSYTLRICLIQHLFTRVLPLPMPFYHPEKGARCFWSSRDIRYETQADIMKLLSQLARHFAAASLSVNITRSGDAVRMLTFSCMACIGDAVLRTIACDTPSQSSLHYSGKALGPGTPFGFAVPQFSEESEYLQFNTPENAACRAQVLDYLHHVEKLVKPDHMIFSFEKGQDCCNADVRFIDQLNLQMGFPRGKEEMYITGELRGILDLYPEIGYFRDLVFMLKLVMLPSTDDLPELKPWTPTDAELTWKTHPVTFEGKEPNRKRIPAYYSVRAFDKKLKCKLPTIPVEEQHLQQVKRSRSAFSGILRFIGLSTAKPRALPSQANPSIVLGERVDTEDDILHIRTMPDFSGTLGASDVELLLQYLTAPYVRIPLVLNFFATESRLRSLRSPDVQGLLDATLFEPGHWQEEILKVYPSQVPHTDREHMSTPAGLLFNEIIRSPDIILKSIQKMLEGVVDMDTGKYSQLSESILFVVRLAIRVEGYLMYLVQNNNYHKSRGANDCAEAYWKADVRGIEANDDLVQDALACQKLVREILEDKIFKIIIRWINVAKSEGKLNLACKLHAHLAFIYRNVETHELNAKIVFTVLASQIFLFNSYKFDIDIGKKQTTGSRNEHDLKDSTDLGIPQIDFFDMFQRNRNKIVNWLRATDDYQRSAVFDAIVQMVEEGEERYSSRKDEKTEVVTRNWISIEHPGFNFKGRFCPK